MKIVTLLSLILRDFNFENLEWKYFAGLKFRDLDESPFFKVIEFHFCIVLTMAEYKCNKQLAEMFNDVSKIVTSFKSTLIQATEPL